MLHYVLITHPRHILLIIMIRHNIDDIYLVILVSYVDDRKYYTLLIRIALLYIITSPAGDE